MREKITLSELEARITQRKKDLGITGRNYVTKNNGSARTESKKALLIEINKHKTASGGDPW